MHSAVLLLFASQHLGTVNAVVDLAVVDNVSARHGGRAHRVRYSGLGMARRQVEGGRSANGVVEIHPIVGDQVGDSVTVDVGKICRRDGSCFAPTAAAAYPQGVGNFYGSLSTKGVGRVLLQKKMFCATDSV